MISKLPAVRRFRGEILEDIRLGRRVVIHIPSYPPLDIRPEVQRAVISELDRNFLTLNVSGNGGTNSCHPGQILCHRFMLFEKGSEYTCIDALFRDEEYLGNVLWIENILPQNFTEWLSFINLYQSEVMKLDPLDRTPICLVCVGELKCKSIASDVGLGIHKWCGRLSNLDIDMLLDSLGQDAERSQFFKELKKNIIRELAGYDWFLAKFLSDQDLKALNTPKGLLEEFAKRYTAFDSVVESSWEKGTLDTFGGRTFKHSSYVAISDDEKEITRRIWRAQVKAIYPFLEEVRIAILHKYSKLFKNGFHFLSIDEIDKYKPQDIFDLEIGQMSFIAWKYHSFPVDVVNDLNVIRHARNDLAHMKPISGEYLKKLERVRCQVM